MARIIINLTVVYDFLAFIELCGLNRVVVDRRKANSDDDDFIKRPSIKCPTAGATYVLITKSFASV